MSAADVGKIKQLLDEYFRIIGDITINPDTGIVDVVTGYSVSVELKIKIRINTLPVQFGRVDGDFYCSNNQLTSLEHAPTSVGGYFDCSYNQLTSLQGAPTSVGGDFSCSHNQLTSLQGVPTSVGGDFRCYKNQQLTSLQGAPKSINGSWGITVYPNTHTPLLRLLLIQGIKKFEFVDPNGNDIYELNSLFQKYYPEGRQGILKCGLEMMSIKNGKYANNARMGPK